MTVKNFDFAARRAAANTKAKSGAKGKKKDVPFTLDKDGPTYYARGEVDDQKLSMASGLFSRAERDEDVADVYEAMENIFKNLFVPATARALIKRMNDPDDQLKPDDLTEIVMWATEMHSGGRPTTSSRT